VRIVVSSGSTSRDAGDGGCGVCWSGRAELVKDVVGVSRDGGDVEVAIEMDERWPCSMAWVNYICQVVFS